MGNFDPARIAAIQTAKMLDDMERSAKVDELYDKIKEKRNNASNDLEHQLHSLVEQLKIKGQIQAYHDVLRLMESMFEIEEELENEN